MKGKAAVRALLKLRARKLEIESKIKELTEPVLEYIGESSYEIDGVRISRTQKTTYEFKHIPSWVAKKAELDLIQNKAKAQFNNTSLGLVSVDEENGEIPDVATAKYSKPSVKVEVVKK